MKIESFCKKWVILLFLLIMFGCNSSSGGDGDKPDERDGQSPSTPEAVNAPEVSPGKVSLSWPAASDNVGVARYRIYRNGSMIAESGETSYIDTALPDPGQYCYAVSAIDEAGNESEQSQPNCADVPPPLDTEPPSVPAGVSASLADSGIRITWSASTDNKAVAGYRIFRNGVKISEITETSFSDSSLSPGTRYCYTVSAFDPSNNESAQSIESCTDSPAARDDQPPSVPSGVSASRSSGTVLLSWSASTDNIAVSGYKIYRNGEYLTSSSTNSFTDTAIIQGRGYCYTVSAFDPSMNESQKSNEACIESLAGKIKWKFPTEYPVSGLVALDSVGTIYAADEKSLYAVSPEGDLKWRFSPEGRISLSYTTSSPVIGPDDTIFLPANNFIYVLNQDGSLRWRSPRINIFDIAVGPDGVMYTSSSYTNNFNNLYGMAINSDGSLKWKTDDYFYKPILDNDGALYVDGDQNIHALNPDGTKRWTYGNIDTSFDSLGMFFGKNGAIYHPSAVRGSYSTINKFNLHALTTDGVGKWVNTTGNIYSYPVVGNDGRIYASTNDGKIVVLNQDGTQAMLSEYNNFLRCSLSVDGNNTIFAVAEDGHLYALNSDLSVKWRTQTGGPIGSPAIGADGTLYFGSSDSSIYAVYSDSPGLSSIWGRARGNNKNSGCVMSGQKYTGTVNPTVPTNISAPEILPNMVKLEWTPSTGISAPIKGYKIYRDGVLVGLKGNGFTDYGLAESARYSYRISAVDMAGNESNLSEILTVTTPGFMEGKLKWKRETENLNYPDVVSIGMDGIVYLASSNYFTGFNANGSIKFTSLINSKGYRSSGSLIFSNYLSIGQDGNLYASGPQSSQLGSSERFFTSFTPDGSTRWKYLASPFAASISQAIAADGTIYLGKPSRVTNEHDALIAFNSDGSVKWQYVVADDEYFSVSFLAIAQDGTIYAVNNDIDPGLYAIRTDGSLKWEYRISFESKIAGPPAIMPDGTILLVESYGGITALNADGTKKWQTLPDEILNSPVVSQDGVIYASGKSSIVAIKPDGSLTWRYETGPSLGEDALYNRTDINQSPVIASDDTIYLGSTDGWLYAFDKDGSLKWKYSTGSPVLSVTVSEDGTLYFRSGAYFYAMQTSSMGLATAGWPKIYHDNQNTGRMP